MIPSEDCPEPERRVRREHPSLFFCKAVPAARQALSCAASPREAAEKAPARNAALEAALRRALEENKAFSAKKEPRVASSASGVFQSRDTDPGISLSHRMGDNGASHMTDASMPGEPAAVKGWDTPEAAREAEARERSMRA